VIARLEDVGLEGHREVATELFTRDDVRPLVGALPHFDVLGPTEQGDSGDTTESTPEGAMSSSYGWGSSGRIGRPFGDIDADQRDAMLAAAAWTLLGIASLLDFVTTQYGLAAGFTEDNPVIKSVIHAYGFAGFAVFKLGALAVVATAVLVVREWSRTAAAGVVAFGALLTSFAALTNALALHGVIA